MTGRSHLSHGKNLFDFLKQAEPSRLAAELLKENMRTVAVVLSNCDPLVSAKTLSRLPAAVQKQVVTVMKSTRDLPDEVLEPVAETLRARLRKPAASSVTPAAAKSPGNVRYGGPEVAAAILRYASAGTRQLLKSSEPELFEKLNDLMFDFDSFIRTPQRSLEAVFSQVETDSLALALKVASPELRNRIIGALSSRRAQIIEDELERQGRVGLGDIEQARQKIVDLALDMQHRGRVVLDGDSEAV